MFKVVLSYRGRLIREADVVFLRELTAHNPTLSRRRLSIKVCEAWQWVQPNSQLRDMVCRSLMLALHPAGQIQLPAKRRETINNAIAHRRIAAVADPQLRLGPAIGYLLKHWQPLTLFLRQAGAPVDNNACERALKMTILHRKNSLSYKTVNGARVGDLFMSLINTCRLNRINPFAYLLAIATHPAEVQTHPSAWLPWNSPVCDGLD